MWYCGTAELLHCITVALWYCGTVALCYCCGTVVLWFCGTAVLWYGANDGKLVFRYFSATIATMAAPRVDLLRLSDRR